MPSSEEGDLHRKGHRALSHLTHLGGQEAGRCYFSCCICFPMSELPGDDSLTRIRSCCICQHVWSLSHTGCWLNSIPMGRGGHPTAGLLTTLYHTLMGHQLPLWAD